MTDTGLERLIERGGDSPGINSEESTSEKIRKAILSQKVPFEGIYGVSDVKENLMSALERASFISRQGYIPIILLIGPTGSGKTELINSIIRTYKQYTMENPIYTLDINDKKCPYNENPYNLYRSVLPQEIKLSHMEDILSKYLMTKKRPEICSQCENNLESITDKSKLILIKRIYPQSSIAELGEGILSPAFINVIKNSNRSILTISADKSRFEEINPKIFQLMNNVYDNNFSDVEGNRIPLDSMIIIHSNEGFMDFSDDDENNSTPLLERIIRVDVRRNLSYSEEMKIIDEYDLPIKQAVPNFNEYISKINILSRLSEDVVNDLDENSLDNILELLDSYDSYRLDDFARKMTKSTTKFIYSLFNESDKEKPEKKYLEHVAKTLITDESGYKSGWSNGISSRAISGIIDFNYNSKNIKENLLFSDIVAYLDKNKGKFTQDLYGEVNEYIGIKVLNDVKSDIDYAVLSFYFGEHFKDYTDRITSYFNYLINSNVAHEFKDAEGYLTEAARYFDLDILKNNSEKFKEEKIPLQTVNYFADFKTIFDFLVHQNNNFIKKESKFKSFMGQSGKDIDTTSELYPYIKNFLKSNLGYFDRATDEAFKIYKEDNLFYDE